MGDISLRHIPDLSDMSDLVGNSSESSFQIPAAAHDGDLLLADETMGFFDNNNDSLNTPIPPARRHFQPPLTLAELTPHSKTARTSMKSSPRRRPVIATPYRETVVSELSAALSQEMSPLRDQDPSSEIPPPHRYEDNLMAGDEDDFLADEQRSLERDSHTHSTFPSSSNTLLAVVSSSPGESPAPPQLSQCQSSEPGVSLQSNAPPTKGQQLHVQSELDTACLSLAVPTTSGSVPEKHSKSDAASKKSNGKVLLKTNLGQKKLPGGDRAKRKRVIPSAAVGKPVKLRPLTASLARRLSSSGKKPAPTVRRRPLQGVASSVTAAGSSRDVAEADHADAKPFRPGGLANALMSFGQKLIASAARSERLDGTLCDEGHPSPVAEAPAIEQDNIDGRSEDLASNRPTEASVSHGYLTLSQLSPRKHDIPGPHTVVSNSDDDAVPTYSSPTPPLLPVAPLERPPSPMRRSIKRAGSPDELSHERKRSKTLTGPSESSSSKELKPHKPALQPARAKNAPAATSTSVSSVRVRRVVSAASAASRAYRSTNAGRAPKPGSSTSQTRTLSSSNPDREYATISGKAAKAPAPGKSSQSSRNALPACGNSRSGQQLSASQKENAPEQVGRPVAEEQDLDRPASSADRPPTNLPPAKPTRPIEFQFATSTRAGARVHPDADQGKASGSGHGGDADPGASTTTASSAASLRRTRGHAPPVPDFKALHALQASVLAQQRERRAEVHPTVPVAFGLATETRAAERERFEEARRAREREAERLAEERRLEREREEEAEIRELRRRAVPKANEVPEWYALAPKKAKAESSK